MGMPKILPSLICERKFPYPLEEKCLAKRPLFNERTLSQPTSEQPKSKRNAGFLQLTVEFANTSANALPVCRAGMLSSRTTSGCPYVW